MQRSSIPSSNIPSIHRMSAEWSSAASGHRPGGPPTPRPLPLPTPVLQARGITEVDYDDDLEYIDESMDIPGSAPGGANGLSSQRYGQAERQRTWQGKDRGKGKFVGGFLKRLPRALRRGSAEERPRHNTNVHHVQSPQPLQPQYSRDPTILITPSPSMSMLDPRFSHLDPRLSHQESRLSHHDSPLSQQDSYLSQHDSRFSRHDLEREPVQQPDFDDAPAAQHGPARRLTVTNPSSPTESTATSSGTALDDSLARIRRVLQRTRRMPWVAQRVAVDFVPGTSSARARTRPDVQARAALNGSGAGAGYAEGTSWYTPSPAQRARALQAQMRMLEAASSATLALGQGVHPLYPGLHPPHAPFNPLSASNSSSLQHGASPQEYASAPSQGYPFPYPYAPGYGFPTQPVYILPENDPQQPRTAHPLQAVYMVPAVLSPTSDRGGLHFASPPWSGNGSPLGGPNPSAAPPTS